MDWEWLYNQLGIREFVYFISSSQIQDALFPVKMVFMTFTMFFLAAVIYFMINSSWLQYKFLEDVTEFFSWQSYGLRELTKRWSRIKKRADSGVEAELKLAIIEADDFLLEVLDDRGFEAKTLEESIEKAGKSMVPNISDVLSAHEMRNSIVYNPDFVIDQDRAKRALDAYELAINNVGVG